MFLWISVDHSHAALFGRKPKYWFHKRVKQLACDITKRQQQVKDFFISGKNTICIEKHWLSGFFSRSEQMKHADLLMDKWLDGGQSDLGSAEPAAATDAIYIVNLPDDLWEQSLYHLNQKEKAKTKLKDNVILLLLHLCFCTFCFLPPDIRSFSYLICTDLT